jgi:uncharacterized protein (TIGR02466 family)
MWYNISKLNYGKIIMSNHEFIEMPLFVTSVGKYTNGNSITKEQKEYIKNLDWGNNGDANKIGYDFNLLEQDIFKDIKSFCIECVDHYYNELLSHNSKLKIIASWANKTEFGEYHRHHKHPNSVISGVYYFDNTTHAPITLHNPNLNINPYHDTVSRPGPLNLGGMDIAMADNSLLLFPSYVWHEVKRSKSKNTRYSIAFNTFFEKDQVIGNYATHLPL